MRTRSRPLAVALAALMLASACGGVSEAPSEPPMNVAGTYVLQSVNGDPLPFPIALDGVQLVEITYETLELDAEGVYDHTIGTMTTRGTTSTADFRRFSGVYDVARNSVTLTRAPDGARAVMTYADGGLTLVSGEFTFAYRRR